ncbi:hypothetical protein RFI_15805 [Reticulomyxa filosa]|uniref:Endonuclease/exonuclease/phosphatase domain-containing protein n=1 Tax=Reticulomyxa filosa TaxID=46433 RepID=X6N6P4_RETFI|nr:hypothetical protein RFI_15805 [Reticulomyxa filosa]|eukprot:ETO21399.1 hypothetical protein RFI_15805 [Reticulomyxa filosa]
MFERYCWPFFIVLFSPASSMSLSVLNYNMWNYMFSWQVRFLHIAETISMYSPDIITLQEIYSVPHGSDSFTREYGDPYNADDQLMYLRKYVSAEKYPYVSFQPTDKQMLSKGSNDQSLLKEGLAIISKYPIINERMFALHSVSTDDRNERFLLRTRIKLAHDVYVDVYVTHLSYDKQLQCKQIQEVVEIMLFQHERRTYGNEDEDIVSKQNVSNERIRCKQNTDNFSWRYELLQRMECPAFVFDRTQLQTLWKIFKKCKTKFYTSKTIKKKKKRREE